MAAGTLLQRGRTVAPVRQEPTAGKKAAHHRERPVQRDKRLRRGRGGGRLPPGREIPLRGLFPLYPPRTPWPFLRRLGVPFEGGAGAGGCSPQSDSAHDIAQALVRYAAGAQVFREPVTELVLREGRVLGVRTSRGSLLCPGRCSSAAGEPLTPAPAPTGTATAWPPRRATGWWTRNPPWCPWWPRGEDCSRAHGPFPAQLRGEGHPGRGRKNRYMRTSGSCCSPFLGCLAPLF